MKKKTCLIELGIVLILPILLFFVIKKPFAPWRPTLQQYLHSMEPMGPFVIRAEAKANHPENFSAYMSKDTYSDSLVFKTEQDFDHNLGAGTSPLPYPPKVVYCVTGEYFGDDQSDFFFIALHTDGQYEAWVLHKYYGSWNGIRHFIDRIGCDIAHY